MARKKERKMIRSQKKREHREWLLQQEREKYGLNEAADRTNNNKTNAKSLDIVSAIEDMETTKPVKKGKLSLSALMPQENYNISIVIEKNVLYKKVNESNSFSRFTSFQLWLQIGVYCWLWLNSISVLLQY